MTTNKFAVFAENFTNEIIAQLEKGTIPWKQPWINAGVCLNYVSQRPYEGFNQFYLNWVCFDKKYTLPYFLTFKQAKELGGSVIKGEKGIQIVYWKKYTDEKESGSQKVKLFPFLHTVFNVAQVSGIDITKLETHHNDHKLNVTAESILASWKNAPIIEHRGNQACYIPVLDTIRLPYPEQFLNSDLYYKTLFHEAIHATGHQTRLDRFKENSAVFGSQEYSKEELVAEIGSSLLCFKAGIDPNLDQTAAYIGNWIKVLKNDHSLLLSAMNKAYKAVQIITLEEDLVLEDQLINP